MISEQRMLKSIQLLIVAEVAIYVLLLFIPGKYIFVRSFTEDGFYSLAVAKNIAEGNGITIDGTTVTNGFQPLFTMISVIPFLLSEGDFALTFQLLYGIHLFIFFATAWIVALCVRDSFEIGRKREAFWITFLFYVSSLYLFLQHANALETGLLMLLYALIWRFIQTRFNENIHSASIIGVLFGFLVLARIDAGIFCTSFALACIWNGRTQNYFSTLKMLAVIVGVAFFVSSPWWVYNVWNFGSVMPTSGLAQQKFILSFDRIIESLRAIIQNLVPYLYAGKHEVLFFDAVRSIVIVIAIFLMRSTIKDFVKMHRNFFIPLLISVAALTIWYAISSNAVYFYERYLIPIVFLSFLSISIAWIKINSLPLKVFLIIFFCSPLMLRNFSAISSESYVSLDDFNRRTNPQYQLVQEYIPEFQCVGAGQSGSLGFLRMNVVNLDGKVNGEALLYQDSMLSYLDKKNIFWLCDTKEYVQRYLTENPDQAGWQLIAQKDNAVLYRRIRE